MLLKSSALALLAVASQVVAEPQPYKAVGAVHKMSVRELFGVVRRTGSDGYSPSSSVCGLGTTCAEACGAGYATCKSTDDAIHCYNAAAQICCPDGSGNSCDDGYYCTGSVGGDTICCPDSQSLSQCAAAYSVSGSLTVEVATSTSTSSSSSSSSSSTSSSAVITSSAAPNTTTSTSSSSSTSAPSTSHHYTTYKANSTAITSWGTSFTTTSCATGGSSAAVSTADAAAAAGTVAAAGNNFTTTGSPSATSAVATSAGEFLKPAGVAAAMLAAAFTFLL